MQALLNAIAEMALPADAQRVFHGRGGMFPGCEHWALDFFPPVWVLTSFQPVADDELASVQAALEEAMKGRTTLVIAHRLSTVINAHRIAVLEQGQLIDIGTHAELLARCELYARLAAAQLDSADHTLAA